MPIEFEDTSDTLRLITITGRLDIQGTAEIDMKFTSLATSGKHRVVVDLTGVSFLASIGIRSIITNAKAQAKRGGRMVLYVGDNAAVAKTLESTGIDSLVPTFTDPALAQQEALA